MSDEDKKLMTQYDFTSESKMIYSYKQHRYENLKDAVNYARLDTDVVISAQENNLDVPTEK